jgi:hypothetical protein
MGRLTCSCYKKKQPIIADGLLLLYILRVIYASDFSDLLLEELFFRVKISF